MAHVWSEIDVKDFYMYVYLKTCLLMQIFFKIQVSYLNNYSLFLLLNIE